MKIINNSAVEFFSTFCPSFYGKKKHARRLSAHVYTIQDLKNAPYRKIMHAPFHGAFDGAQLLSGKVLTRD